MATARASTPKADFKPTLVHAYRRQPVFKHGPNGVIVGPDGSPVEEEVEVVFDGEKVKFRSNEAGHIVGLVKKESTFNRLTKEIPEAYIPYADGENVPERSIVPQAPTKPAGKFVLAAGDEFMVLDDMSDTEVREFAAGAQIEAEALPEALAGDALKQAVCNLLTAE